MVELDDTLIKPDDTHEKAEQIARELEIEHLKLNNRRNGLSCNGLAFNVTTIKKAYKLMRGEVHLMDEPYLEPSILYQKLLEIKLFDAEVAKKEARYHARSGLFDSPMAFILYYFEYWNITISPNGIIYKHFANGLHECPLHTLESELALEMVEYNHNIPDDANLPPLTKDQIKDALGVHLQAIRRARIVELRNRLQYRPTPETDINAFITELLNIYYIETHDANISAFKHLIWQIKRKLWDRDIPYVLFYTLQGGQGTGKSEFFRRMCTGFEWIFSDQGSLQRMLDHKDLKSMCRGKYLVDNQELTLPASMWDAASVAEAINQFKSIITSTTVGGRVMHGPEDETVLQTAVFVSSTNKHVYDTLPDPSGMRRFWEFNIKAPKGTLPDFETANEMFNHIEWLYQAIDENDDQGHYHTRKPHYEAMQKIQEMYQREDTLLRYVHSQPWEFCSGDDTGAKKLTITTLRQSFNSYLNRVEGTQKKWECARIRRMLANAQIDPVSENGEPTDYYWTRGKSKDIS
jgi:hypothetical protein